jgi:transcriptional regulator with XRE-family HTH domain
MPRKSAKEGPETIAQRLRRLRREKGISQVEMAELLDVSQPIVSAYERGLLRLHGELIVKLREILDCSADELLGLQERKATNSGSNLRMARRLQQIKLLPKSDQEALRRVIDAFISKAGKAKDLG